MPQTTTDTPAHQHYCSAFDDGGTCTFLGRSVGKGRTFDLYVHTGGKHPALYVRWGSGGEEEGMPASCLSVPPYVRDNELAGALRDAGMRAYTRGLLTNKGD